MLKKKRILLEQRRLTGPWVPAKEGTGFTYAHQRI